MNEIIGKAGEYVFDKDFRAVGVLVFDMQQTGGDEGILRIALPPADDNKALQFVDLKRMVDASGNVGWWVGPEVVVSPDQFRGSGYIKPVFMGHIFRAMTDEEIGETEGMYRVGMDFNPSGDPQVTRIKAMAADLIDEINRIEVKPGLESAAIGRLKSHAMTLIEDGAMNAVKAATKRPRRS